MMFCNRLVNNIGWLNIRRNISTEIEVRIPSPFGHIAGKWWGPTNKRPVLCLHGWQDTCDSFDPLLQLLPKDVSYLAVDIPGHGLSSRLPPGVFYHYTNSVFTIKTIKNYFGWNKVSFMGHSLGAIFSYIYTFLSPQEVDFLICIDNLHPIVPKNPIDRAVRSIKEFEIYNVHAESKHEPPSFTKEELCERLYRANMKSIELQNCALMMRRNIAASKLHPGKFYMTRDPRLRTGSIVLWSTEDLLEAAKRITCPIFISKSTESPTHSDQVKLNKHLKILQAGCKDYEFHFVEGTHHVHFNYPELLDKKIGGFLEKHIKDVDREMDETRLKNIIVT